MRQQVWAGRVAGLMIAGHGAMSAAQQAFAAGRWRSAVQPTHAAQHTPVACPLGALPLPALPAGYYYNSLQRWYYDKSTGKQALYLH